MSERLAATAAAKPSMNAIDEVLEDEDREDEVGLVVGEPPEVDQPLDRDRARRDVDARGEDEAAEVVPKAATPTTRPSPAFTTRSIGPPSPTWRPRPDEPREAELEAEEEEEEDDPELRDELGDLGGADE